MKKKTKSKSAPKPRKLKRGPVTAEDTECAEKTNRRPDNRTSRIGSGPRPATAKDKEELIRIWDEDLCE